MNRKALYEFKTPRRLNEAKADLYGWLIRNGRPASGIGPRPEDFEPDSPIRAALNSLSSQDERKWQRAGSFEYLRLSIYASELTHGIRDHFDCLLASFGQQGHSLEDALSTASEPTDSRSTASSTRLSILVRAIRLALVAFLIAVAISVFAFWHEARVADARIAEAIQAQREAVAALSVSLPSHYAECYSLAHTIGCATGAAISGAARADLEHAIATTARLIGAFADSPYVSLHVAPLLTTSSRSGCGSAASEAPRAAHILRALCEGRVGLIDHLLCADGKEPSTGVACRDMARLGIAGTRFEPDVARDLPRPVNVFSQPLELSEELTRLAALADVVAVGPDFTEMADSFMARYFSFRPISVAWKWIASI